MNLLLHTLVMFWDLQPSFSYFSDSTFFIHPFLGFVPSTVEHLSWQLPPEFLENQYLLS